MSWTVLPFAADPSPAEAAAVRAFARGGRLFLLDAYLVAFFVVFLTQADGLLARVGALPLRGALAFLLLAPPVLGLSLSRVLHWPAGRRGRLLAGLRQTLPVWVPLAVLVFLALVGSLFSGAVWSGHGRFIFLIPFDAVVVLTTLAILVEDRQHKLFRHVLAASFMLYLATVLLDVAYPGLFSFMTTRAAGLAASPNRGALVLVLIATAWVDHRRFTFGGTMILVLTAGGVLATLSRGGAVLFVMLLAGHVLFAGFGGVPETVSWRNLRRLTAGTVLALAVLAAAAGLMAVARVAPGALATDPSQNRLTMFSDPEHFVTHMEERSAAGREALERVRESPLFGRGTGFTQRLERPPHDMYLELWLDAGPPAAISFILMLVALLVVCWRHRMPAGVLVAAMLLVSGLFSDSLLNDRTFLILLGALLAGVARQQASVTAPSTAGCSSA